MEHTALLGERKDLITKDWLNFEQIVDAKELMDDIDSLLNSSIDGLLESLNNQLERLVMGMDELDQAKHAEGLLDYKVLELFNESGIVEELISNARKYLVENVDRPVVEQYTEYLRQVNSNEEFDLAKGWYNRVDVEKKDFEKRWFKAFSQRYQEKIYSTLINRIISKKQETHE